LDYNNVGLTPSQASIDLINKSERSVDFVNYTNRTTKIEKMQK